MIPTWGAAFGANAIFNSAEFRADLTHSAIPDKAASGTTGTFTRATTSTWQNNDGYQVTGVAGEIGFVGARREYNQISNGGSYKSEGAFNSWTKGGVPPTVTDGIAGPDGRLTAARVVFAGSGAGNAIYTVGVNGTGRTGIVSAQIRGDAAGTIRLLASNSGAFIDAAVTTEWQRFTIPAFAMTNTDGVAFLRNDVGQLGTIYVADAMIKDVTAQTTQTAGEYVSVGVVQRNKLLWTEDLTNAVWTKINGGTGTAPVVTAGQTDPNGGTTAFRVQANSGGSATGADYSVVRQTLGAALSSTAKRSIYIKSNTGSNQTIYFGIPANNNSVTATTSWQRLDVTSGASSSLFDIGAYPGGGTGNGGATCDVLVWHPQGEENTSVTDYQAVGGSYPYHGSFVDGVKCFPTDLAGNPLTTMLGYQAEGARTNVLLRSEEFDNATWSKSSSGVASVPVVTANQAVAPNGTLTADKIVMTLNGGTASGDVSQIYQAPSTGAGTYTGSLWLKGEVGGEVVLLRHVAGADYTQMTLTTEWKRFSATEVRAANNFELTLRGSFGSSNAVTIYAWGAQLELGSFASSYIATTTAAVTRNADVLTYSAAGNTTDAAGWAYAEIYTPSYATDAVNAHVFVGFGNPTGMLNSGNRPVTQITSYDGTTIVEKTGLSSMQTATRKRGITWGGSTQLAAGDGATPASGAFDGGIGVSTNIYIGCNSSGTQQADAIMRNVRLGTRKLSSSEQQAITA